MQEQEFRYGGIEVLIELLNTGERPLDKFLAQSLEELYLSNQYRSAILTGSRNPNEKRTFSAIRIVAIRENRLDSLVLSNSGNKQKNRRFLDTMIKETKKIPVEPLPAGSLRVLSDLALNQLRASQLQTVAAMQISTSIETGKEIVEACYPKLFMDLMPVPKEYKSDSGLVFSTYFLKVVPFGSGKITIVVPSH